MTFLSGKAQVVRGGSDASVARSYDPVAQCVPVGMRVERNGPKTITVDPSGNIVDQD